MDFTNMKGWKTFQLNLENIIKNDFAEVINRNLIKLFIEACKNCKPELKLSNTELIFLLVGEEIGGFVETNSLKNKSKWRGLSLIINKKYPYIYEYHYEQRGEKITSTYTLNTNI